MMAILHNFRHRGPSFADLVPYAGLVADGVILLKDGSLIAGWYYSGPDAESSTNLERNEISRHINAALVQLGSGWMLHVDAMRIPSRGYPEPHRSAFPDQITLAIDNERRAQFERESGHFESQHALILTYRVPEPKSSALVRYMYSDPESRSARFADRVLEQFQTATRAFAQRLGTVLTLRRMATHAVRDPSSGRTALYDDLFQFVRFCISGENHPVRLPCIPMYLDWLATAEFQHGLEPMVDGRSLAVVGLDGFPAESFPGILNALDLMPLSYRWSSRFIFLDEHEARARLERTRNKWRQKVRPFLDQLFQTQARAVDQDAMIMVAETEDAIASASSQLVSYGYYTSVVILFDTDRAALLEKAEAVRRLIQAEGFGARIEGLNATEAYLGSLPGNSLANVREPLINTANLSDLLPFNSVWTGEPCCPCPLYPPMAPPLMQVASASTPFRLNLHVDDLGHTLIFGPTGSGKSTLLALIIAQFRRYADAQIFAFDKGRSLFPITVGAGGDHYDIELGEGLDRLAFCPLAEIDSETDRAWAADWIETLVGLQGLAVTPELRNSVARQLQLMAHSPNRSLSDFVSGVQSRELKEALLHYTIDGPMGHLLDAEHDGLALGTLQTFEMDALMGLGERTLVPVLLYLFRRIEKRLTGAPSLIVLDEAWLMLGHALFREKIREWLKVLRKANCAVILATQSISDAERSGIIDVIKESCPTKICLPNGAARESGTREFYERLGFNQRQIEIVAAAMPKREYYVTSPVGRRLFDMALGPIALAFVGASSKADLSRIEALRRIHGPSWSRIWLSERGISDAHPLLKDR